MRSALYTGTVMHARRTPAENVFCYRVAFYVLDLDELPELQRRLRLFGYNRPNVLTLRDRDHLGDPRRPVQENLHAFLAEHGIDVRGGRISLLTNLRVLGYVFNPVSFFYCYRADGELECIVAEVSNTFGERLPYLLSRDNEARSGKNHSYLADKRLHVSPFFSLDQAYQFFFSEPEEQIYARIDVFEGGERPFQAALVGRRQELSNATVGRALVRYPVMPAQVIGLIHWQALKLYVKGAPFFHKPPFVPGHGSSRALAPVIPTQGGERSSTHHPQGAYRAGVRPGNSNRADMDTESGQSSRDAAG